MSRVASSVGVSGGRFLSTNKKPTTFKLLPLQYALVCKNRIFSKLWDHIHIWFALNSQFNNPEIFVTPTFLHWLAMTNLNVTGSPDQRWCECRVLKTDMPVQKGDQTCQSKKETKQAVHRLTLTFTNNTRKALAHK